MPNLRQLTSRTWHSPTAMTWLSFAARSAGPFLVLPLILRHFSKAETSYWFLVSSIASLLMMADFGFSPSFIRAIAYARSGRRSLEDASDLMEGPNEPLMATIYRVLHRAYLTLTLIGGLVGAPLAAWALLKPISELTHRTDGAIAFAIVCLSSFFVFRNSAYSQWLQGLNLVAKVRRAEAVLALFTTLLTALAIYLTHSFLWGIAFSQLGALASSLVVRQIARPTTPKMTDFGTYSEKEVMDFIWPAAWRSGVGVLMSNAPIQASGIIYAQFGTSEQTAPYLFAMRIMQMILVISMAPFYSKIPWFASLYGANRHQELIPNVRQAMARSHWVYVIGVIGVCVCMTPLLHAIGSKTQFVSTTLWLTIGFAFLIERVGGMHLQFYSLSNHILWHVANGVSGSLYVISSLALIHFCGAFAFPIAMVIGYGGFYSWYSCMLSTRHYRYSYFKFEAGAALLPLLALLATAVITLTAAHFP